jgi:uncharacterized protein (TIGR02265 family)
MTSLGSEEELFQRLTSLDPTHTMRGFFFNSVLEVVRLLGDESAVKHCLSAAGEPRYLDFFSYPTESYVRMLYTAAKRLSDRYGGFEGALRVMGARTVMKFFDSAAGRALQVVVEGNPKRLLENLPATHRMGLRGGKCTLRWEGSTRGVLFIERISAPAPFIEGALHTLFEATRARNLKVASRQTAPLDVEFEVSWE